MEDLELVQKLKRGDNDAFRLVVDAYQSLVLNCAFKFLRNREASEDITQEVFLEVYRSIHRFRMESKLSTWIYRIAISKCLNQLKKQKRQKRFGKLISLTGKVHSEQPLSGMEQSTPANSLEQQERAEILQQAIEKLAENQRIAFTLSKYKELSYEEIAQIMNTSVSGVESLLHRAKVNLRKTLERYYSKQ